MGSVEDAIAKRIGVVGVTDGGVPLLDGKLRGDERRATLGTLFDDLHEVASVRVLERVKEPVIDGEQVNLGEPTQKPYVGAVTARDAKVVNERRCCTALAESEIRLWWWPRYVRA